MYCTVKKMSKEEEDEWERIQLEIAMSESLAINLDGKKDLSSQELALFTDSKLSTDRRKLSDGKQSKISDSTDISHKKVFESETKREPSSSSAGNRSTGVGTINRVFQYMVGSVPTSMPMTNTTLVNMCEKCSTPIVAGSMLTALNKTYHATCFRCAHCGEVIDGPFTPRGTPPSVYHQLCAENLFLPKCCLCSSRLSGQHLRHPYFDDEVYCLSHDQLRACFSCGRKEPMIGPKAGTFASLADGRLVCGDCSSSIIMESSEAQAIYLKAVDFMELWLGLTIPPGMRQVPVLAVDLPSLNENKSRQSTAVDAPYCGAGLESTVRGLTMSTCGEIRHMNRGSASFDRGSGMYTLNSGSAAVLKIEEVRDVTAVLVLFGLPRELTSSILAHEATHVWMKLTKSMPFQLPPKVEEGLCQVVAHKYLEEIGAESTAATSDTMAEREFSQWQEEEQLRGYFMHQIAADQNPVYGAGFREAQRCVDALGLSVVLDHVQHSKAFPTI